MRFVKRWKYTITLVGLLLIVTLLISVMIHQRSDCIDKGGNYVRGMFWFECVGGR